MSSFTGTEYLYEDLLPNPYNVSASRNENEEGKHEYDNEMLWFYVSMIFQICSRILGCDRFFACQSKIKL